MYSLAIPFDAIVDLSSYAVRARFPDLAPPDAYPFLAHDRGISQGFQEPVPAWLARCREWLDRWAHAGSAWGVLMAVRGVVSPDLCAVATVTPLGTWDSYPNGTQDGIDVPPLHDGSMAYPFDWCSKSWPFQTVPAANRAIVVVWPDSGLPWKESTQTWGDGSTWDDGRLWDIGGPGTTAQQFVELLAAVALWKAGHTWVPSVVIAWSAFDFAYGGGGSQPDGYYGTWSKIVSSGGRTHRVPSRYAGAAYLAGVN